MSSHTSFRPTAPTNRPWPSSASATSTGYRIYRDDVLLTTVGAQTSYSDTTVTAGNSYDYEVSALDATGHESQRTNIATAATPLTLTIDAQADARVQQSNASTNYGTATTLRTDGGADSDVESFLRFQVAGISGSVKSAKLRLFATTGTANGPAVYKTAWTGSETSLTWNTRTPRTSGATDDKGAIAAGGFVEFDVKSLVTGNGQHSFILATTSTDEVDFSTREGTASRVPQLVITFGNDTEAPIPPSNLTAQGASSTRVDLAWTAATDDFGVTGYKIYRDDALLTTVGAQTSYSDTTVSAGNSYDYEVSAVDGTGHESGRSNTATVTIPFVFTAEADARVQQANATTNYGSQTTLRTDGGADPDVETFLRFPTAGLPASIQNAKLRVYATTGTVDGPAVYKTAWTGSETVAHLEHPSCAHQRRHRRQGRDPGIELRRVRRHLADHGRRHPQLHPRHDVHRRARLQLAGDRHRRAKTAAPDYALGR